MVVADGFFGLPPQARYTPLHRWPLCLGDISIYKIMRRFLARPDVLALEVTHPYLTDAAASSWWTTTALPQLQSIWLEEVDRWVGEGRDLDPCAYADDDQNREIERLCAKIPCVQYLSNKNNSLRFKAAFSAGGALNPDFEEHVAYYGTLIEAAVAAAGASNDKHQAKAVGAFSFSFPLLRNKNPETGRPAGKQFMSHKHNGNRTPYDQNQINIRILSYPQFVAWATNGGQGPGAVVHPTHDNAALQGLVRRLCQVTGAVATFQEAAEQAFTTQGANPVRFRAMNGPPAAPVVAAPPALPAPVVAAPPALPAPVVAAPPALPAPVVAAPPALPAPVVAPAAAAAAGSDDEDSVGGGTSGGESEDEEEDEDEDEDGDSSSDYNPDEV